MGHLSVHGDRRAHKSFFLRSCVRVCVTQWDFQSQRTVTRRLILRGRSLAAKTPFYLLIGWGVREIPLLENKSFKVSKFLGFSVSWFLSFLVSWFQSLKVLMIPYYQNFLSCFSGRSWSHFQFSKRIRWIVRIFGTRLLDMFTKSDFQHVDIYKHIISHQRDILSLWCLASPKHA